METQRIRDNAARAIPQRMEMLGLAGGADVRGMEQEDLFTEASMLFSFLRAANAHNDDKLSGGAVLPDVSARWGELAAEVARRNAGEQGTHS